jgi:hypothetical protein
LRQGSAARECARGLLGHRLAGSLAGHYRRCRCHRPVGPAHMASAPLAGRRGPRHVPLPGVVPPAPRSGAGRSAAIEHPTEVHRTCKGCPPRTWPPS